MKRFTIFVSTIILLALAANVFAAYTTVIDNGPASNRVNMVFLGDGYTASQIETTYVADINKYLNHMFHENQDPFTRYEKFFNAYRINVVSNQSGADVPPSGIYRDTALDASYYYDGVTERLLYVNESKANTAFTNGLAGSGITADMKLVTVNDTRYGGGGGNYAVYAGGNSSAPEVALHESGHSFSGLADEYFYGTDTTYTGSEPSEVNVTKNSTGAKWSQWLGYVDPDHPELGSVGAYRGRPCTTIMACTGPRTIPKCAAWELPSMPSAARKSFSTSTATCVPSIIRSRNQGTLIDPQSLWIDVVDPNVIKVQWSVDGNILSGATSENFDPYAAPAGNAHHHGPSLRRHAVGPPGQQSAFAIDQLVGGRHPGSWIKGADGLWSEPGSWSRGSVPLTSDDVVISGR